MQITIKRPRRGSPPAEAELSVIGQHGSNQYIKLKASDGLALEISGPRLALRLRELANELEGAKQ